MIFYAFNSDNRNLVRASFFYLGLVLRNLPKTGGYRIKNPSIDERVLFVFSP